MNFSYLRLIVLLGMAFIINSNFILGQTLLGNNTFEDGSKNSWTCTNFYNTNARTGTYCIGLLKVSAGSGTVTLISAQFTKDVSNTYFHAIMWAKASSSVNTVPFNLSQGSGYANINLTTTYQRITMDYNNSAAKGVKAGINGSCTTSIANTYFYIDDVILYEDNTAASDVCKTE